MHRVVSIFCFYKLKDRKRGILVLRGVDRALGGDDALLEFWRCRSAMVKLLLLILILIGYCGRHCDRVVIRQLCGLRAGSNEQERGKGALV